MASGSNAVAAWRELGFSAPHRAASPEEAAQMLARLEAYERTCKDGKMAGDARFKTHLLLPWCHQLVRSEAILNVVEELLGCSDLLCWSSGWAIKEPADAALQGGCFYSWHQDSTYAGINPASQVATVWIALTASTKDRGCVRAVSGSHQKGQLHHDETFAELNMLARGQRVDLEANGLGASGIVDLELSPGQFSVHHFHTVHGSDANRHPTERRIGLQVVYMPTSCKPEAGLGSAMLVRGEDRLGHWQLEQPPSRELGEAERTEHARAMSVENEAYHKGSQREGYHR